MEHRQSLHVIPKDARSQLGKAKVLSCRKNSANTHRTTNRQFNCWIKPQISLFLQTLKETGARRGEAFNLQWIDIDLTTGTIRITPEKGSNPRAFTISSKLLKMLATQPHEHQGRIWKYKSITTLDATFRKQRKRIAHKLQDPKLLQIHFHILRHWKATIEYAKTKDLLYVQKLLGHRNLKTTLRYTQLLALPQNEE